MSNEIVLILKSMAANLAILKAWGYQFPRIITVIAENGMQASIMNALANFSLSNNKENRNSDFVFYYMGKSGVRSVEIEDIKEEHLFDGKGKCGLPIIVTDNPILKDESKSQFFIFMENKMEFEHYSVSEIVPLPEDLDVIRNKLFELDESSTTEEEKTLKAAVYFLAPYCFRNNNMKLLEKLLSVVDKLCIIEEESRDVGDLEDIFVKVLYEWQRKTNFCTIHELGRIDSLDLDIQNALFHDSLYVYMSEKMFKHIVKSMIEYVPINSLKKGLVDAGILELGNKDSMTYTVKVRIPTKENKYNRSNLLRFNREKIESYGEIGIVDACYLSREDESDE